MEKDGERLVLYSTRHGRITELLEDGVAPNFVQAEAGHTAFQTTQRYMHLRDKLRVEAIRGSKT